MPGTTVIKNIIDVWMIHMKLQIKIILKKELSCQLSGRYLTKKVEHLSKDIY